jgi:hypothetical protein
MQGFVRTALIAAAASCLMPAAAGAQGEPAGPIDEIVVTAQRTGIPVWRVRGPKTSIILIGSIEGVTKDTRWDPGALAATLRKADRVMFPGMVALTGSPFALIGYFAKWRGQATLPKGQTLAQLLPPQQFQRLVALRNRGILKAGFERKHPFHLARDLQERARGGAGDGLDAGRFVEKTVRKHKIRTVPLASFQAKGVLKDFFALPPRTFVPCLADAITAAEAGPAAARARSLAWAERRVPDVLASPADRAYATCSPKSFGVIDRPDLRLVSRRLMAEAQVTVAVVDLRDLAARGGVLDSLQAAGFAISGPSWR